MTIKNIAALFTANVRERWENVLTIYFEEIFFFDSIEVNNGRVRVVFKGNPTNWCVSHYRAYLDFDPSKSKPPRIEFGFILDKGSDDLRIQFSNVEITRITQTPEALMQVLHHELSG